MKYTNKVYGSTAKSGGVVDRDSYWYHRRQNQQQNELLRAWSRERRAAKKNK